MEDIQRLTIASCSFILLYTMVSKYIQTHFHIPDPPIAIIYGMIIGKTGLGFLSPHKVFSKVVLSRSARILLCLQTMVVSLTTPKNYIFRNRRSLVTLVVLLGILKCSLVYLLLRSFSSIENASCWAIAASLTPTDPVLCSSIVEGTFAVKNVPEKLRILLNAESGINDGLGILMLDISTLVLNSQSYQDGFLNFLIYSIVIKCLVSGFIGYFLGAVTRKIARHCCGIEALRSEVLSLQTFALSFLGLAIMDTIGGSELICIFFMGSAINSDGWYTLESTNKKMAEIVEVAFSNVFFVLLGSFIDFKRFNLRLVLFNILIIVFTRPLSLFAGYKMIPLIENLREAMFIGWFGPIGVGALYYCILYDTESNNLIIDFVLCSVLLSTIMHGFTVPIYCLFKRIHLKLKHKSL